RAFIDGWHRSGLITQNERAILMASLINSMDRVANTAGTYYAYLKPWYRKALRPFLFELIPPTQGSPSSAFLLDACTLVSIEKFDVLYLDPPYNARCYAQYYHLPETLALSQAPEVFGKSGIPHVGRVTSDYNKRDSALRELQRLVQTARFRYLVFHYSYSGLIGPAKLRALLSQYGAVEEHLLSSKGYST